MHDQLVDMSGGGRLQLRDIPELALRWLEILTEMGGLPDTDRSRRAGHGNRFRQVTVEVPLPATDEQAIEDVLRETGLLAVSEEV